MDDYETDLSMDDHVTENSWYGADEVALGSVPNDLWSDCPVGKHPDEPEQWVDRLADQVELTRLCSMKVLEEVDFQSLIKESI